MRIIACPGQGSQSQGFLTPWIESIPGFRAKLVELGEACGKDLVYLGTEADEETIKDTANAQPLIVGASIAAYRTALQTLEIDFVVGHSVGEFAAAAISGVLTDEDAMKLVGIRAQAMAEAATQHPTSMAAILGGEAEQVIAHLEAMGLEAANYNGSGQIVAAGAKSLISELISNPIAGTRCIELKVAGAFHTDYMQSAVATLQEAAASVTVSDPQLKLVSNQAGQQVEGGSEFLSLLVSQVANPVRWDLCMAALNLEGAQLIELPPAGALAGLAKRGMAQVSAIALKSPADLEKIGH